MALCSDERIGALALFSRFFGPLPSAGPPARTKSAAGQGHGGARTTMAKAD